MTAIESTTITTRDGGAMPVDVAAPAAPGKGLIIISAIWGVNEEIHEFMGEWAQRGYLTWAPDMFWRTYPGPVDRDNRETAQKRYNEYDCDQGVADLGDVVSAMRADDRCTGKVAVLGYCFGGRYAYLGGTRLGIDGAISFHGTKIGLNLDEADKLACPITIHVGDNDPSIPMDEVNATIAALEGNGAAEVSVYPGCVHGFTGRGRPSYDEAADKASTAAACALLEAM